MDDQDHFRPEIVDGMTVAPSLRTTLRAVGLIGAGGLVGWLTRWRFPQLTAPIEEAIDPKGEWLTTPLARDTHPQFGDVVFYEGHDLTEQNRHGDLHTYYARGQYVALDKQPYTGGTNYWTITDEVKAAHPDWENNTDWSLDVMWYDKDGEPPADLVAGTSSH